MTASSSPGASVSSGLGLYQPGGSLLHRAPAGAKLAGLAVAAVGVLRITTVPNLVLAFAVTLLAAGLARIPWRVGLAQLRPVLWFAVPLLAFQWLTAGPHRAVLVVGQLLLMVTLAALVTLTTRVSAMLDAFEAGLRPLRRVGVSPARVALVLALTVRCVPLVAQTFAETREAQRARGLERSPAALVVPLVIRLLKRADAIGEALAARGVDDDPADTGGRPRR
ncbi:energy-coupling factor transporter transmembrane component T family protein [Actinopolymorpha singaporensis]|uniref:Biotin transport system permease protein n=1 Tax=Actinopolymorpha singaporensis TaxID=117157 RepID=A0A1H1XK24_9ACTN|nr:energy-coupling factor transporter transmembrane protein EcfT [Actinopolymorpha singaporensis]SDT09608.1 biotin transport system permease protein [Actinopolymorpha singaporensis]